MIDLILSVTLVSGGFFALLGSIGLIRLPDVLIRMHASTKIGTLACGMVMASTVVYFGSVDIIVRAVAIVLFLFLTAPIAAHMIGRAAVNTGVPLWRTSTTPKNASSSASETDGDHPSEPAPR